MGSLLWHLGPSSCAFPSSCDPGGAGILPSVGVVQRDPAVPSLPKASHEPIPVLGLPLLQISSSLSLTFPLPWFVQGMSCPWVIPRVLPSWEHSQVIPGAGDVCKSLFHAQKLCCLSNVASVKLCALQLSPLPRGCSQACSQTPAMSN